jgi:cell division protein ZipA
MEHLRWVLIGFGILVLVGVYLLYVLERRYPHWFSKAKPEAEEDTNISEDEIIYLHVRSREGEFAGSDLLRAMQKFNMVHGDMGIFHRLTEGSEQPLFSIANMVEPGSFDADKLATLTTPGLVLFLRLPRSFDALHSLDELISTAKGLAQELDGELLDRYRQPFSLQKQQSLRDEVLEYMRQIALQERISQYQ